MSEVDPAIRSYEITRSKNGYFVTPERPQGRGWWGEDLYTFEKLDNAIAFVRERLEALEAGEKK